MDAQPAVTPFMELVSTQLVWGFCALSFAAIAVLAFVEGYRGIRDEAATAIAGLKAMALLILAASIAYFGLSWMLELRMEYGAPMLFALAGILGALAGFFSGEWFASRGWTGIWPGVRGFLRPRILLAWTVYVLVELPLFGEACRMLDGRSCLAAAAVLLLVAFIFARMLLVRGLGRSWIRRLAIAAIVVAAMQYALWVVLAVVGSLHGMYAEDALATPASVLLLRFHLAGALLAALPFLFNRDALDLPRALCRRSRDPRHGA